MRNGYPKGCEELATMLIHKYTHIKIPPMEVTGKDPQEQDTENYIEVSPPYCIEQFFLRTCVLTITVGDGELPASNDDDALLGNDTTTYSQKRDTSESWRMFAPFLLLICVFLLGVYLLVGGRLWPFTGGGNSGLKCAEGQKVYTTIKGDSCWDIKSRFGMTLQELEAINEGVDCDDLQIGQQLCVKNIPTA
jgi:hypothetical protein